MNEQEQRLRPSKSNLRQMQQTCGRKVVRQRWPYNEPGLLDDELVQGVLMVTVFVIPIAVSLVLPRMIYRTTAQADVAQPPHPIAAAALRDEMSTPMTASNEAPTIESTPQLGVDAIYHRGRQRLKKGDYEGAICDFDDVLGQKREFIWCYYYRAGAFSRMGNQLAALDDLGRASAAMPAEARVWRARAVVHQRMGNLTEAVGDICRAVELVPTSSRNKDAAFAKSVKAKADELLNDLVEHASTALQSGDFATAIEEFGAVLQQRPESASAWLRRAVAYDEACVFEKALDDVNVALRLRPGPAQAYKLRSVLHERKSDYVAALVDMRAAQRLLPGRADYGERIRWLLRQQERQRTQQVAARWRLR